jgi:hypothetical protein
MVGSSTPTYRPPLFNPLRSLRDLCASPLSFFFSPRLALPPCHSPSCLTPLFATLTHFLASKSIPCRSYTNSPGYTTKRLSLRAKRALLRLRALSARRICFFSSSSRSMVHGTRLQSSRAPLTRHFLAANPCAAAALFCTFLQFFAFCKNLSAFVSTKSGLVAQNTRGVGISDPSNLQPSQPSDLPTSSLSATMLAPVRWSKPRGGVS